MLGTLRKKTYGYFLIWGHGLGYEKEIIDLIKKQKNLEILSVFYYKVKNIARFVRMVYSYDYAPLWHLSAKTQYLLTTPPKVLFVFFCNHDPQEEYFGQGNFRHQECLRIKNLKEEIRNIYNPKKNKKRTEEHVVHASDNEAQADYILKNLGYKKGVASFRHKPNPILNLPYSFENFKSFVIKKINLNHLWANIWFEQKVGAAKKRLVKIKKSPHYSFLKGNKTSYLNYLSLCYKEGHIRPNCSGENFKRMAHDFQYLKKPHARSYILVNPAEKNDYVIIDGVHRAAILFSQGMNKALAAVISGEKKYEKKNLF
jgi:hypothetical protein